MFAIKIYSNVFVTLLKQLINTFINVWLLILSMPSRKKDVNKDRSNDYLDLLDDCYKFAEDVIKNVDGVVSVVLFGSVVRKISKKQPIENINDIDILILVDDLNIVLDEDFVINYRNKIQEIANNYEKLHITTTRLSKFWELVIHADPVMISIVREGIPLFDSKIFVIFKKLLFNGHIKPTPESIALQFNKARLGLDRARNKAISLLIDIYWAVVDAFQSLAMYYKQLPEAPENITKQMLRLKKDKRDFPLSKQDIDFFQELYDLTKRVMHRQKRKVEFYLLDEIEKRANEIISKLEDFYND